MCNIEHRVRTRTVIYFVAVKLNRKWRMRMSDNVTLFPNILQPVIVLKTYAPMGVRFWENQETALAGLREFADGWFGRRHKSTQAALEAAKHIGEAATPSDILQEYQNWLTRAMELLTEDAKAYQQQVLRAVSAKPEAPRTDERRAG
jgi:hypothetical protein